jgi:citrate lyase subunit beta/citryl-CoA lyase
MTDKARVGRDAKEDLIVEMTPAEGGGVTIDLQSSVATLYGEAIEAQVRRTAEALGLDGVAIHIEDHGALDWVIDARVEAAAAKLRPEAELPAVLPEHVPERDFEVERNRMRRSRLYLPGNQPDLALNAGLFSPDGVILDLEDAVAPAQKDQARYLVRNALRAIDFGPSERMVRINQLPRGLDDLEYVVPHGVHTILIPKAEQAADVLGVADRIAQLTDRTIWLMPILESALGVERGFEIAAAHPTVVALAFGAEDFTKDIGAQRTDKGTESFVARSKLVLAARAAGVQPIDTVYSDVGNEAGLLAATAEAISLGFDGKGCIHPRQVRVIHDAFRPDDAAVAYAVKVKRAMAEAEARGDGAVSIGRKMIDPPVVARAMRTLKLAEFYGITPEEVSR